MTLDLEQIVQRLIRLHDDIRESVIDARNRSLVMESPVHVRGGDTQYAIDVEVEPLLLGHAERWRDWEPFALVAEGLPGGVVSFPRDAAEARISRWILIDPIDGTRGLMLDKRPGWILSGVAEGRGGRPTLDQIEVAVQSEIPLTKQNRYDVLSAVKGKGARRIRRSLDADAETSMPLSPSRAETLEHGFSCIAMFFPETKVEGARLMKWIADGLSTGSSGAEPMAIFDDQYLSSGGQLYELMIGHDRFIGDYRPRFFDHLRRSGLCCHPYDLCTELIARECGVRVTDGFGGALRAPFDVATSVSWAGFANEILEAKIQPLIDDWFRRLESPGREHSF